MLCHRREDGISDTTININSITDNRTLTVERWAIAQPVLEFQTGQSLIVLNYDTALDSTKVRDNEEENAVISSASLWSNECRSGGGTEIKSKGDDQSALIVDVNPDSSVSSIGIDLSWLLSDFGVQVSNRTMPLSFCVRYALSAKTTTPMGDIEPLEINFVESIVTVNAALVISEEQQVPGIIAASIRHRKSFDNDFKVEGFVCDPLGRKSAHQTFLPGNVITLCVLPPRLDGSIQIASIEEFTWKKLLSIDYDSEVASQQAVENGVASDFLTKYRGCHVEEMTYCSLSTLLLTKFYSRPHGLIGGTGTVSVQFGETRSQVPQKVQRVEIGSRNQQRAERRAKVM